MRPAADLLPEQVRPIFWKNKSALRVALNGNPLLGLCPCVRRTVQPTYGERLWLFSLYFVTGLFLEHLSLLYGPICREAYVDQCGYDTFDGPNATTDGGGRRLFHDQLLTSARTSIKVVGDASKDAEYQIGSSREVIISLLSGKIPKLNCNMTKCDHWEQVALRQHTGKDDHGDRDGEYMTFLYLPGMCRCNKNLGQKITFKIAVAITSVVFQSVMFSSFHAVLSRDWEQRQGFTHKIHNCVMYLLGFMMLFEMVAIFLIRFVPEAWIISLGVSALSVVTVSFCMQYVMTHLGLSRVPPELRDDDAAGSRPGEDNVKQGLLKADADKTPEASA